MPTGHAEVVGEGAPPLLSAEIEDLATKRHHLAVRAIATEDNQATAQSAGSYLSANGGCFRRSKSCGPGGRGGRGFGGAAHACTTVLAERKPGGCWLVTHRAANASTRRGSDASDGGRSRG